MVEDQVHVEVIPLDRDPLLAGDEVEVTTEFEEEVLQPGDEGLLEVVFLPGSGLGEAGDSRT